ncbi:MAG: hypothetical protein AB1758_19645, partial [Candidatus Eremiobacterota bacterium]
MIRPVGPVSMPGLVDELIRSVHGSACSEDKVILAALVRTGEGAEVAVAVVPPDAADRYAPLGLLPVQDLPPEQLHGAAVRLLAQVDPAMPERGLGLAHFRQLQQLYPNV